MPSKSLQFHFGFRSLRLRYFAIESWLQTLSLSEFKGCSLLSATTAGFFSSNSGGKQASCHCIPNVVYILSRSCSRPDKPKCLQIRTWPAQYLDGFHKTLRENIWPSVWDLKLKHTWILQQNNNPEHGSESIGSILYETSTYCYL